jgi:hypothetical protein
MPRRCSTKRICGSSMPKMWRGTTARISLAVAARGEGHIVVDQARSRHHQRRGGDAVHVTLEEALVVAREPDHDLVALDEPLTTLAAVGARNSQVWKSDLRRAHDRRDGRGAAGLTRYGETRLAVAKLWLLRDVAAPHDVHTHSANDAAFRIPSCSIDFWSSVQSATVVPWPWPTALIEEGDGQRNRRLLSFSFRFLNRPSKKRGRVCPEMCPNDCAQNGRPADDTKHSCDYT